MKVVLLSQVKPLETDTPNRALTMPVLTWEMYDKIVALLEAQEAEDDK